MSDLIAKPRSSIEIGRIEVSIPVNHNSYDYKPGGPGGGWSSQPIGNIQPLRVEVRTYRHQPDAACILLRDKAALTIHYESIDAVIGLLQKAKETMSMVNGIDTSGMSPELAESYRRAAAAAKECGVDW